MINYQRPTKYKYTVTGSELSKQIATSPGRIVRAIIVTGGGSSATVRVVDSANGSAEAGPGPGNYLVSANTGESTPFYPYGIMERGLYIELEQGGAFNGEATVFYD